jgi:hypothetical protein
LPAAVELAPNLGAPAESAAAELEQGGMMSITAHSRTAGDTGAKARLPMLAPSLAALLYPFALKGFNGSVTRIPDVGAGAIALSWLSAAVFLARQK